MAAVPSSFRFPATPARSGVSVARSRRIALVIVAVLAVAVGATLATFASRPTSADPELIVLLRAMAAIKALLVVAALGVVAWRFGRPTSSGVALVYGASIAAMSFATALIACTTFVGLAALAFHAGLFAGLWTAWRDDLPRRKD